MNLNRDQFIEHNGARLRFRAAGNGPAVVLIHGWALDMDMWEPQFAALAAHYHVIAFDRRGFGQSTGQPCVTEDVQDVRYLLGALQVRRAALVGMSQGARVALRCASGFGHAVSCLILDGSPGVAVPQDDEVTEEVPLARYRDLVRLEGIEAVRQEWAQHRFMALRTGDAYAHALLRRIIGRYPGRDLLCAASPYLPSALDLKTVGAPTLLINGEHDSPQRRSTSDDMCSVMPHAQRSIVPNAGHLPNLDNPVAYNALLADFLRIHAGAGL